MYGAKITELVLVACSKDHLLSSQKGKVPRVIHKLLIPINPYKTIQPKATEITGKTIVPSSLFYCWLIFHFITFLFTRFGQLDA